MSLAVYLTYSCSEMWPRCAAHREDRLSPMLTSRRVQSLHIQPSASHPSRAGGQVSPPKNTLSASLPNDLIVTCRLCLSSFASSTHPRTLAAAVTFVMRSIKPRKRVSRSDDDWEQMHARSNLRQNTATFPTVERIVADHLLEIANSALRQDEVGFFSGLHCPLSLREQISEGIFQQLCSFGLKLNL